MSKMRITYLIVFTILISLALFVASDRVNAEGWVALHDCSGSNDGIIILICYATQIHDQNKEIIEKLDWNNCAISYKTARNYAYEYGSFGMASERAHNYKELVEYCGELP